jgi:hypothetical protein
MSFTTIQNFQFTDELFYDFHMVDPRLIHLNYCVIDYTRLTIQVNEGEGQVRRLYQIPAFNNCIGAVFSFSKACRPFFFAIDTILSLPQKSFVIDFSGYKPTNEDCSIIRFAQIDGDLLVKKSSIFLQPMAQSADTS